MMNIYLYIFIVGIWSPAIGYAQIDDPNEVDSIIIEINQKQYSQSRDTLLRNVIIADSVLGEFLNVNSEFIELFKSGEDTILPTVSFSIIDTTVIKIQYGYHGLFETRRVCYYFLNERLVKQYSSNEKYILPTAMSSCDGWAKSSSITYYKKNISIKSVNTSDPCFGLGITGFTEILSLQATLKMMLELIHGLNDFILYEK